ncbi:FMN-linked oxidoreductase [Mycena galericulata]|nr:FMN-linked oxidoreductase [Mycena galericulata]
MASNNSSQCNLDPDNAPKLFTPIQLGGLQLRHRVVLAPLTRLRVDPATKVIFPIVETFYAQRASTPGTMLISEGVLPAQKMGAYTPPAHGDSAGAEEWKPTSVWGGALHAASPGIWSDAQIVAWRKVTDAVHARGSFIYCQLFGMGRAAATPDLAAPGVDFDLVSPSAIPLPGMESIVPRALTVEEIHEYIALFMKAAENAVHKAGFDGVEVDAANGYLLDAFLQSTANQRTDAYGGSPANRARLLLEIVAATAQAIGAERIGVRISPWSSYQGMLMPDPVPTFTHLVQSLRALTGAGPPLAYLHVVEPRINGANMSALTAANAGHSNDFIRKIWLGSDANGSQRRYISAGGYTRESALAHAETQSEGELVAFGRAFLANPDLPIRLLQNIPLTKGDRRLYYVSTENPEGYTSYPFASALPDSNSDSEGKELLLKAGKGQEGKRA